jgi:hypothetical protein
MPTFVKRTRHKQGGAKGLMGAVLARALLDAMPPEFRARGNVSRRDREQAHAFATRRSFARRAEVEYRDAMAWFLSDSHKPYAFLEICEHLDLDPQWIREQLLKPRDADELVAMAMRAKEVARDGVEA